MTAAFGPEVGRKAVHPETGWVELIHTDEAGEFFFFVAMRLVSGNAHESPILYELVEEFLQTVGPGVMKWLVVDRGFLDGEKMAHLKTRGG